MSKTLIVSDNEILNQLYIINLEVYLATTVALVFTAQKAEELILNGEQFDLIITMNMINGHDSAATLHEFLEKNKIKIPLIVVGNPLKEIKNIVVVPSSFNLQNLLRSCAEILGVTAKSMAQMKVSDYYPVSAKFLMTIEAAPCPIYLQMKKSGEENSFTIVAKTDSDLRPILKKFMDEGIDIFYVSKLDRLKVINKISNVLCEFIKNTEHFGVVEKSDALKLGFDFAASDFCQSPQATTELMGLAQTCAKTMDEITKEVPGLKALLNLLNSSKDGYVYTHSILASYVASHIVRCVSWGGESHMTKINFVLFFHDLMLGPIYAKHPELKLEEDLLFSDVLSEKEKEVVLNHARMAAELIITYKRAPLGADLLIKQHHGMTNGVGFASEYRDDISPLSKVVIIAEAFVEEYIRGKDMNPNYQINIKNVMMQLHEKFNRSTYRKIIETLETMTL